MESLAFNITARIDDLLYVDDATKQRAAAESISLYDQGRFGGALPKQRRISLSPFPFRHAPSGNPCAMRASYSSDEVGESPERRICSPLNNGNLRDPLDDGSLERLAF